MNEVKKERVEIVNIFRIQVKRSTFVFHLKIDEDNLNVSKKLTYFGGAKVLFKKIEFKQKIRVEGKTAQEKLKFGATISQTIYRQF